MLGFFIEKILKLLGFLIYLDTQNMIKLYIYNIVDWKCLCMRYIPNTYSDDNRLNEEAFLELQFKYRKGISLYLSQFINFKKIDEEIEKIGIPIIEDSEYNFYHRNSFFGSKYLYLRNNIHLERLSDEELEKLKEDGFNELNFYKDTYEKVMYEEGDLTSYGINPTDDNTKKSKALIFEFAYDQKKCKTLEELRKIDDCYTRLFKFIKEILDKENIESDYLVYQCIPDIFKVKENI